MDTFVYFVGLATCVFVLWLATWTSFPFNLINMITALVVWRTLWRNRHLL